MQLYQLHLHYGPMHHLVVLRGNFLLVSFFFFFLFLSEVSKFESSLLVIHVEKAVNGLTAANISVYDLRFEPVILFGQANGVRDLQCFGSQRTQSVF